MNTTENLRVLLGVFYPRILSYPYLNFQLEILTILCDL